jgi:hypothetical protein
VNSLELDSVIVQARLGSARLLYKLGSTRLGYCTSSARARLSSTRLGSFTGLPGSITSWEELLKQFYHRFFPMSRVNGARKEISSFTQDEDEKFTECWT